MKVTDMGEVFNDVTVMYPRINRTYRFDSVENKTVPCDPMDDGAAYELSFMIGKDEARARPPRLGSGLLALGGEL